MSNPYGQDRFENDDGRGLRDLSDYVMVRDAYDRALEKLVLSRTFMTLEAQQAFDEEWSRHMHKNYDLKGAAESIKELIDSQRDLPPDAKAVLYGNLDRLYLR